MFKYAIIKSFEELNRSLELCDINRNDKKYIKEVNYRIGTFIHWLIDYYDRIIIEKKINIKNNDKYFFSGIKYINNTIKHEINLITISHKEGGIAFPISFPCAIPEICFKFIKIKELKNRSYEMQYNNYCQYIADKEVMSICEKALNILRLE